MRWLPMVMLAGCVPISSEEYAGGRSESLDSSVVSGEARDDASASAMDSETPNTSPIVDSATNIAPPPRLDDGGSRDAGVIVEDAGYILDAGRPDARVDGGKLDAGSDAELVVTCSTEGALCDQFELGLGCPNVPGPRWTECEHIDDPIGPTLEELVGGSHALRSRVGDGPQSRSQRVLRTVPLDADYFEAEFWLIVDPSPNAYFTIVKLQQEAGLSADGEPLYWPGISLVGSNNKLLLVVESALSLTQEPFYDETELGGLPNDWAFAKLKITWKPQLKVELELGNYPLGGVTITGLPNNAVPIGRQYFALGLYSEESGAVQMLFDDVLAHARKNGKLSPLP